VIDRVRFGRALRQLRREKSAAEERDVSQAEVAKFVGDRQPNVAKWESGSVPDDEAIVRKLAEFYGVTFVWLTLGEGPKYIDVVIHNRDGSIAAVEAKRTETPKLGLGKAADEKPGKGRRRA
jgi:transcriptional regulator with XRE-family HTH domain